MLYFLTFVIIVLAWFFNGADREALKMIGWLLLFAVICTLLFAGNGGNGGYKCDAIDPSDCPESRYVL